MNSAGRLSSLTDPRVVAALLRRYGLSPSRYRGQSFLVSRPHLEIVVRGAELTAGDAVLEVGAGLGVLTRALAEVVGPGGKVLALEVDTGLYRVLSAETAADLPQVEVLHADALEADLPALIRERLGGGPVPVAANIPYSITSPLLVRLLSLGPRLVSRLVLMVQREVARRLTAAPGTPEYGSLTLFTHLHADCRLLGEVPREAFHPAPRVDSAVVRLDLLPGPRFPGLDPERYLAVVHAAFQMRRKTLPNALAGPALGWPRSEALAALASAGIDPGRRGETLSPEEFARLAAAGPTGPRTGSPPVGG